MVKKSPAGAAPVYQTYRTPGWRDNPNLKYFVPTQTPALTRGNRIVYTELIRNEDGEATGMIGFTCPHWKHWKQYFFSEHRPQSLNHPPAFLYNVCENLPKHVDTILIFGCGSGREFIPFNKKYNLVGVDIAPEEEISWVDNFSNFNYHACLIENFFEYTDERNIFQDLSKTFIYAAGVLMYLKKEQQFMFYKKIKERGCKNIIFNEYLAAVADKCRGLPSMAFGDSGLNLLHLVDDFILRELSGTKDCPITAHINVDIPLEKIMSF